MKLERVCVELSNATRMIENGHSDRAHEVSEVGVLKNRRFGDAEHKIRHPGYT